MPTGLRMVEELPPSPLSDEQRCFVRGCLDVVIDLARLYGFNDKGYRLGPTQRHWEYMAALASTPMKFAKWKFAAFYSAHMGQIVPPFPCGHGIDPLQLGMEVPGCILGGRGYSWLRGLATHDQDKFHSFLVSMLNAKKGCPRPGEKELEKAEADAFAKLTGHVDLSVIDHVTWNVNCEDMFDDYALFYEEAQDKAGHRTGWPEEHGSPVGVMAGESVPFEEPDARRMHAGPEWEESIRQAGFLHPVGLYEFKVDLGDRATRRLAAKNRSFPILSHYHLRREIHRTVFELFCGTDAPDELEPFFPSTSANYNNTRALGGAVGYLRNLPELSDLFAGCCGEELVQLKWNRRGRSTGHYTVNDRRLREAFHAMRERLWELIDESDGKRSGTSSRSDPDGFGLFTAVPLALPEALKTRVITKGPPIVQTLMAPYQRAMHNVLRRHPCFRLIGEPVSEELLTERFANGLPAGRRWLSIDYSDATNEIHSFCSLEVVNALSNVWALGILERDVFERSLIGHHIEYGGVRKPQTRGQLMGSITSFPVLCIINAAICRWALEQSDMRTYTLAEAPLLINGDDGILHTNERGPELWELMAGLAGLSPSVGKVYFSEHFFNINSTTFHYYPMGFPSTWSSRLFDDAHPEHWTRKPLPLRRIRKVPYINMGLMYGLKRSGGRASLEDAGNYPTFGAIARELVSSAPSDCRESVLASFIHRNSVQLKKFPIPWFLPEHLGGLGLPTVGRFAPCDFDLRVARKLWSHPQLYSIPSRPTAAEWQIWKLALARLPAHFESSTAAFATEYCSSGGQGTSQLIQPVGLNTILSALCVEAFFRSASMSDLIRDMKGEERRILSRYYRSLASTLRKARNDNTIPLPEPFNPARYPAPLAGRGDVPVASRIRMEQ